MGADQITGVQDYLGNLMLLHIKKGFLIRIKSDEIIDKVTVEKIR